MITTVENSLAYYPSELNNKKWISLIAYKSCVFLIFLTLTVGCNKGNDPDSKFISIEEFEQQISDSLDEQATNCGQVDIGASPFNVNTCVSDSFILNMPFYAVYIQQGIDSSVASAFTMNSSGVVEYWSYDSDITGGSGAESRVTATVCENPSVTPDLNDINIIECTS